MRFVAIALAALTACAHHKDSTMLTGSNKQLVRNLFETYINQGQLDRLHEVVGPDFVGVNGQRGPSAFAAPLVALREAFPDLVYTVEDLVADGDRVAVRWSWTGTHRAAFRNWAPSGKHVRNTGLAIMRVSDGKVAGTELETDRLGFLIAIGAVPYNPAFGPPPATR